MNFQQIISTARDIFIVAIGTLYVIAVIALLVINLRINSLHNTMEKKVKSFEGQGRNIPLPIIQRQQEKARKEHMLVIDKWTRRRRLFLDLIPFIGGKS